MITPPKQILPLLFISSNHDSDSAQTMTKVLISFPVLVNSLLSKLQSSS